MERFRHDSAVRRRLERVPTELNTALALVGVGQLLEPYSALSTKFSEGKTD